MNARYMVAFSIATLVSLSACGKTGSGAPVEAGAGESSTAGTSTAGGPAVGGATGAGGVPSELVDGVPVSSSPLTRLGNFELNRTISDLFRPEAPFLPAAGQLTEDQDGDDPMIDVGVPLATALHGVVHAVAERVSSDPSAIAAVAGCDPNKVKEAECRDRFLDKFLRRAYRRAVTDDDRDEMREVFAGGVELGGGFAGGVRAVIEVVLQGPDFLYLVELGNGEVSSNGLVPSSGDVSTVRADTVALTGYETAARLAYLFTGSAPDDELSALADQGRLDAATIEAQARRLLGTGPNRWRVRHFYARLLGIDALQVADGYSADLAGAAQEETARFVEDVIFDSNGTFGALLTTPSTWVNGPLATFYGYPDVTGPAFQKVTLDPRKRAGFLTQSAFLRATSPSDRTSPVQRGVRVRGRLLCQLIPQPPSSPSPVLPMPGDGLTTRQGLDQAVAQPQCATCHALIDPFGYAFEHYDQLGLWRDVDNGQAIDSSGVFTTHDTMEPFADAIELSEHIAQSEDGKSCFVNHWLDAALRRPISEADSLLSASVEQAFRDHDERAAELMVAVTQIGNWRYRLVSDLAP